MTATASARPGPPRDSRASARMAWGLVLGSFALYAAFFHPLGTRIGLAYIPLGIGPIVLGAWFFGRRGGLIASVAMMAMGDVLALAFGTIEPPFLLSVTHATRFGAGLLVGFTVGWVRDLQGTLAEEKVHLVQEVDARRAKETELRRAQRRLDEAEEIGRLGSWEVDLAAARVDWSPSLQHLLEAPLPQGDYEAALARVHVQDRTRLVENIRTRLQGNLPFDEECRISLSGGREIRLRIRGQPFFDEDGAMVRLVGLAQDVTAIHAAEAERRLAELQREDIERLAQLNQFKGQFIGAAAHELNTPMTPIILQLELLKKPQLGSLTEAQAKSLEILERNLRRLANLMKDLLDAARMQSTGLRMLYEPTRIAQ
ncbi:MAG: PAS domain-containing protein, partial [Euryarchaeota archaeon]|nr:PAS domain-containing protein [Euryarchaeota archaeon]